MAIQTAEPWITLHGLPGVGKTTVAQLLAQQLGGVFVAESDPEWLALVAKITDNFRDTADVQAAFAIRFLQINHRVEAPLPRHQPVVSDFSQATPLVFFRSFVGPPNDGELPLHAAHLLIPSRRVPSIPDIGIYLRMPIDAVMERIRERGRTFEVGGPSGGAPNRPFLRKVWMEAQHHWLPYGLLKPTPIGMDGGAYTTENLIRLERTYLHYQSVLGHRFRIIDIRAEQTPDDVTAMIASHVKTIRDRDASRERAVFMQSGILE